MTNPLFHKFAVFSIVDDSDTVIVKYVECNNCGVVHKVYDLCKSEIMTGREDLRSQLTIEDFKFSLPSDLFSLLIQYNRDIPDFEYALFILENNAWGSSIVLTREELDGTTQGKLLKFTEPNKFRIESYLHREVVDEK
tara:strand:+ start:178 stop:591 length:414 start_codon:yes stop_codon:yes gene_type:complete